MGLQSQTDDGLDYLLPDFRSGTCRLIHSDCFEEMEMMEPESAQFFLTDPPYLLSGGGTTCQNGARVVVNKGKWDKKVTPDKSLEFHLGWLERSRRVMDVNATIAAFCNKDTAWEIGYAMKLLGMVILNDITWEKPNPPPNLGCRCFTHSTERIIWAKRSKKARHYFDYEAMKSVTGKQMKDVWRFSAPARSEKEHGRHPAQKPIDILLRLLQAAAPPEGMVIDPFMGVGSSGVATKVLNALTGRKTRFTGIELETEFFKIATQRLRAA